MQRKMMPLEAPGPGVAGIGCAEYGDVVLLGISRKACPLLERADDMLELHDVRGCQVPSLAEAALQQDSCALLLPGIEIAERHAAAR